MNLANVADRYDDSHSYARESVELFHELLHEVEELVLSVSVGLHQASNFRKCQNGAFSDISASFSLHKPKSHLPGDVVTLLSAPCTLLSASGRTAYNKSPTDLWFNFLEDDTCAAYDTIQLEYDKNQDD